ncbi:hypothetical protein [Salsipaludibacter albus]|uniref:hypothetical protein n=1 Tax=Salsipaludibacter albus TaxID=2849650 RepID=UPI001EE49A2B|nr:hypothetical protein [Salsipaludibacter albus]MBY5161274.1 hypothetical protein [Salsipaludibacter albus]
MLGSSADVVTPAALADASKTLRAMADRCTVGRPRHTGFNDSDVAIVVEEFLVDGVLPTPSSACVQLQRSEDPAASGSG